MHSIIASQLRESRTGEAEGTLNDAFALALAAGLVIGGLIEVWVGVMPYRAPASGVEGIHFVH